MYTHISVGRKIEQIFFIFQLRFILGNAWVAQLVKYPTLGFGLGHDLMVCGFEPCVCLCTYSMEHAWDSLSLSLYPCPIQMPPLKNE